MRNKDLRQCVLEADVWQTGHVVLNSGLHSGVKLDMERLPNNLGSLIAVMGTTEACQMHGVNI